LTTSNLKILLVDDESLARAKMRRFLSEMAQHAHIVESENGVSALTEISRSPPDIMFLDIQMPGLSGFDVVFQLPEAQFPIVFQTAFDEFAVKAFEANACDYLLKPYSKERFLKSFYRALEIVNRREPALDTKIENLIDALPGNNFFLERLCVDQSGVKIIVQSSEAEAFISKDHYTCILTDTAEYLSNTSLSILESRLNPLYFMRIHRNALVNIRAIKSLTRGDNPTIELRCGQTLTVSRRSKAALFEALKGY
jgi:two-component system, LytTR family, response regulator